MPSDTAGAEHRTSGDSPDASAWDAHWDRLSGRPSLFGRAASATRRRLLSRAVRGYAARFFPKDGVFVEMGCGSAESSARIARDGRRLVALDFSFRALFAARRIAVFDAFASGDLFRLPFRDASLGGIWNLGVMEHFSEEAGAAILREFWRVLKPGGVAVLFWPPEFGASRLVLAPIEWWISKRNGRPFHFFPDEVNRLRSRRQAAEALRAARFEPAAVEFSPRDLFIHVVAVGRKPL